MERINILKRLAHMFLCAHCGGGSLDDSMTIICGELQLHGVALGTWPVRWMLMLRRVLST